MMQLIKSLLAPKTLLLLCLGYTALITLLFLFPGSEIPSIDLPLDKVVHVLIHGVLFLLWGLYAQRAMVKPVRKNTLYYVALGCLLYGIIIEVLQEALVPLRHADVMDILANMVGMLLGMLLVYRSNKHFKKEN